MLNKLFKSVTSLEYLSSPPSPLRAAEALLATPDALIVGSVTEALTDVSCWGVTRGDGKVPVMPTKEYFRDKPKSKYIYRWTEKTVREITFKRKNRNSSGKFLKPLSVVFSYQFEKVEFTREGRQISGKNDEYCGCVALSLTVNGVPVEPAAAGWAMLEKYLNLKKVFDDSKAASAQALKSMEENEKKWNLFEELTGMKRDGNGRLVALSEPVVAEPVDMTTKQGPKVKKNPFHPHCCEVDASGETCLCVTK